MWSCDQIGSFTVIMVSVYLPSDALSQHLPSYLGFSFLGHGVCLHGCSNKAQPLLLTLNEGYLLTAASRDIERGVASRSKCLLISWLQSPSAVILAPRKIKSATVFTVSPSTCHEVMGPDAIILVF